MPWSVRIKYLGRPESFRGSLELAGYHSLGSDTAIHLGIGSRRSNFINSVLPSLINVQGRGELPLTRFMTASLTLTKSVTGTSAPNGLAATLGLIFRWDESSKTPTADSEATPESHPDRAYTKSNRGFVDYAFEAKVTRVNDRLHLLKIDKGSTEGVKVGQIFDVFTTQSDGSAASAVARAEVTAVKSGEAALTVREYFKEVWIDVGFIVKRPVQ
jgi:hypothetical protein